MNQTQLALRSSPLCPCLSKHYSAAYSLANMGFIHCPRYVNKILILKGHYTENHVQALVPCDVWRVTWAVHWATRNSSPQLLQMQCIKLRGTVPSKLSCPLHVDVLQLLHIQRLTGSISAAIDTKHFLLISAPIQDEATAYRNSIVETHNQQICKIWSIDRHIF
jgi:hypothetical protein